MKTFNDLKFGPHPSAKDLGIVASLAFDNGYAISIVANVEGGTCFYGDHPNTYEVAIFNPNGRFVPLQPHDDVLGWQDKMQVSKLMDQFQQDGFQHEKLLQKTKQDKQNND
jgi:hypothetical protein